MGQLKQYSDDYLMTETEVSENFGLKLGTMRNWRSYHRGIPYVKIGKSVRYKYSDIKKYVEANTVDPENDVAV